MTVKRNVKRQLISMAFDNLRDSSQDLFSDLKHILAISPTLKRLQQR